MIGFSLLTAAITVFGKGQERVNYALGVQLDSLRTRSQNFSNVLVYSRDAQNVFFEHDKGLGCAKVAELDHATLQRLGFAIDLESSSSGAFKWAALRPSTWLPTAGTLSPTGVASLAVLLILLVGLYLYSSFLFWLLCVKVGAEPGILVWLPVVQILPMLRAAKMSVLGPALLLLLLIGSIFLWSHLGAYAWILGVSSAIACFACFLTWSIKICRLRNKRPYLAALLTVPGLNFFALLYLAGSE